MKRKVFWSFSVALILAGMLFAASASAQERAQSPASDMAFGLGYQGMWVQGFLHGVSGRFWMQDDIGMEGNLYMGDFGDDLSSVGGLSLFLIEGKFMYAPVVRENSRFYFGGLLNICIYDDNDADGTILGLGPFFGAEWRYKELPEIGFNFDLGFKYFHDSDDVYDVWGFDTTWGIHYYF